MVNQHLKYDYVIFCYEHHDLASDRYAYSYMVTQRGETVRECARISEHKSRERNGLVCILESLDGISDASIYLVVSSPYMERTLTKILNKATFRALDNRNKYLPQMIPIIRRVLLKRLKIAHIWGARDRDSQLLHLKELCDLKIGELS